MAVWYDKNQTLEQGNNAIVKYRIKTISYSEMVRSNGGYGFIALQKGNYII